MNILHYTVGIPPLRKGGAVNYVVKLAKQQILDGNQVTILYPGSLKIFSRNKSSITTRRNKINGVNVCVLTNPLPISIDNGFYSYNAFTQKRNVDTAIQFLKSRKIDIVHLHTITGMPLELLEYIKKSGIKVFYTTHDYLGISPNRLFYVDGKDYSNNNTDKFWHIVNNSSKHKKLKTYVFQSRYYSVFRFILKKILNFVRLSYQSGGDTQKEISSFDISDNERKQIAHIRNYYKKMFSCVDHFLFNSTISKDVFQHNLKDIDGEVIHITVLESSNRNLRKKGKKDHRINIGYIGPYYEKYKGFYTMYNAAGHYSDQASFNFVFMGDTKKITEKNNIINLGMFTNKENAYSKIDLLVIASECKETFGLIGLEAIQNGVPVISSSNAGFKDLVPNRFIYRNQEELYKVLDGVNTYNNFYYAYFKQSGKSNLESIKDHSKKIEKIYKRYSCSMRTENAN